MDATKAIVLSVETAGEADCAVNAYTERFGKEIFIAKGARRMSAKLRSDLRPHALVELSFVRGKNSALLTGSRLIEECVAYAMPAHAQLAAVFIAGFADALLAQPERDERVFNTVLTSFRAIGGSTSALSSWCIAQRFVWTLAASLGFFVFAGTCGKCRTALSSGAVLCGGEFLCGSCGRDGIAIDGEDLYALERLVRGKFVEEPPQHVREHLNRAAASFFARDEVRIAVVPDHAASYLNLVV